MDINFEYYKIFYNVAKTENITKTAENLLISQPAISKSIKKLEEQIGCLLFTRNKKGVTLTEEGKILYKEIKIAIEIMENAKRKIDDITNLQSGTLNIGISNTLTQKYLLPYIIEFNKKYPKISIKIHTEPTYALIKKARNGLVDFIIINLPTTIPKDFNITILKEIQDCFVANKNYNELKTKTIKLTELNQYPLILLAKGSNGRFYLDDICEKLSITLTPKFELASYSLVAEFIKSGIGIGLLTKDFIKEELDSKNLFEIKTTPKLPKRHIGLIFQINNPLSHCSQKFISFLTKK